jgi:hypothetical protein
MSWQEPFKKGVSAFKSNDLLSALSQFDEVGILDFVLSPWHSLEHVGNIP